MRTRDSRFCQPATTHPKRGETSVERLSLHAAHRSRDIGGFALDGGGVAEELMRNALAKDVAKRGFGHATVLGAAG